ncbi:hypothetical protein SAY86_014903 [Trapa natans]|uniref:Uncharacterized protein n=1 Tax=Trapa natans TaxID=22666 RepID=A0AAN7KM34_TRANT|nr:hypothetical protein SAY86_014903 [Trapa natans]
MAKAVVNQVGETYYHHNLKKAALVRLSFVHSSLKVLKFGPKKRNRASQPRRAAGRGGTFTLRYA